jgi:hypothetical protein
LPRLLLLLTLALSACRQRAAPDPSPSASPLEPEPGPTANYLYFRDLQAFLPADLPGFQRVKDEGSTGKYGPVRVSEAERVFSQGEDRELAVRIVDTYKLDRLVSPVQAEEQRPSLDPRAKRFALPSGAGYLKYDPVEFTAEATLVVADRFAVSVISHGFRGTEEVAKVAKGLDLPGLAKLR